MTKLFALALLLAIFAAAGLHAQSVNDNTTLLSQLAPQGKGGKDPFAAPGYSDVWGYTANSREYALLGHFFGTSVIDVTDPASPKQISFLPGPGSPWRDIDTHSHYAYVTNETGGGLHLIDLQYLPDSAVSRGFYNAAFQTAHTLYIDNGFAYACGSNTAFGVNMLDLSNPIAPVERGRWSQTYFHDLFVKNDTLYGSAIYSPGTIDIVDARNKANPSLISSTHYPGAFTHNLWMTSDTKYIAQCDEIHDQPVNFWDISDRKALELVATYHGGPNSIAHNAYIHGDYVFLSYYYDGLRVLDISHREAPVEVGNYDTYPDDSLQRGDSYEGAWSAYPFLPSGNILIADITYGLVIVKFNGTKAGYLSGVIRDAATGAPLSDVKVEMLDRPPSEGLTNTHVGADGKYLIGAKPGARAFRFSRMRYYDFVLSDFNVQAGAVHTQDIALTPIPTGSVQISLRTDNDQPIASAPVRITGKDYQQQFTSDPSGNLNLQLLYGDYHLTFFNWGYTRKDISFTLAAPGPVPLILKSARAYIETFTEAQPWSLQEPSDQSIRDWLIVGAKQLPSPLNRFLLAQDHTMDSSAFVAASLALNGASTLTSPVMDAAPLDDPHLQFARYFNPYNSATTQANDTLKVLASNDNGASWKPIAAYTGIDQSWQVLTYRLADYLTASSAMKVRFVHIEGPDARRLPTYAMLDDFKVVSKNALTRVEEKPVVLPGRFALEQNYPNPFNPQTVIRWQQPRAGEVEIVISNLLGQKVAAYALGVLPAGAHHFQIDLGAQPSGVYLYQVRVAGEASGMKKMLLMR